MLQTLNYPNATRNESNIIPKTYGLPVSDLMIAKGLKKVKNEKIIFQLYLADARNLTLLQHEYDVTTLYGR